MIEGILGGAVGVGTSANISEGEVGYITSDTLKSILNSIGINSNTGYDIDSMDTEGLINTLMKFAKPSLEPISEKISSAGLSSTLNLSFILLAIASLK